MWNVRRDAGLRSFAEAWGLDKFSEGPLWRDKGKALTQETRSFRRVLRVCDVCLRSRVGGGVRPHLMQM